MSCSTRTRLILATLELMRDTSVKEITVKEIAYEAGVSRRTFYTHFSSVKQLLTSHIEGLFLELIEKFRKQNELSIQIYTKFLLEFINEHKELFLLIIRNEGLDSRNVFKTLIEDLDTVLESYFPDSELIMSEYLEIFVKGGFNAVVLKWLDEECRTPQEKIMSLLLRLSETISKIDRDGSITPAADELRET